ncbi:MAG: hypothetical protein WC222_11820 [Parachlamydiales bacterium]|jgi:hypothetical protein
MTAVNTIQNIDKILVGMNWWKSKVKHPIADKVINNAVLNTILG